MKKLNLGILGFLLFLLGGLAGVLSRQPKINNLKKQVAFLQKEPIRLQKLCQSYQDDFRNLYAQHKALKAYRLREKAASKEKSKENLILQYAIKDHIELLFKCVKDEQKLSKEEIAFFNASENVIEGKPLSASDKVIIKNFVLKRHSAAIENFQECDYTLIFQELNIS